MDDNDVFIDEFGDKWVKLSEDLSIRYFDEGDLLELAPDPDVKGRHMQ